MKLDDVIPWGRSLDEYRAMFALSAADVASRILGCGDGPASFNADGTELGYRITSCDPIYEFTGAQVESRVHQSYPAMIAQVKAKPDNFRWELFRDPDHLVEYRLAAMRGFLADYEAGKASGRYVAASLPRLPFADAAFDLALCSHFLFLYSAHIDLAFHRQALQELLRVAREVRIFPLLDLDCVRSAHVEPVCAFLRSEGHQVEIVRVPYEFQRGGNEMLRIRRRHSSQSMC
ncbi:MAG TPA: class I SAM-dependent methyltransferase [Pirellulales bacterium]|jgi:SAM-dependent methyltransferase